MYIQQQQYMHESATNKAGWLNCETLVRAVRKERKQYRPTWQSASKTGERRTVRRRGQASRRRRGGPWRRRRGGPRGRRGWAEARRTARLSVNVRLSEDEALTRRYRHYGVVGLLAGRKRNTKKIPARSGPLLQCARLMRDEKRVFR